MLENTPHDTIPTWVSALIAALFGGGAVKMLQVWLENKRLSKKEYRETLQSLLEQQSKRIGELETCISGMQIRIGNLRVEVAYLESENSEMRKATGLPPRKEKINESQRQDDAS